MSTLTIARPRRRGLWHDLWRGRWGIFYVTPFLLGLATFGVFPPLYSLWLSFHEWDILSPIKAVGLANYARIFTREPLFWQSITNGLLMAVMGTLPCLVLALALAFILHRRVRRARNLLTAAFFSPAVSSAAAAGIVFNFLFSGQGLINGLLRSISLPPAQWLASAWGLRIVLALLLIWRWLGWNAVIYLAGMQSVPDELYEAAEVDGASNWTLFWKITVPLVRPTILFTGVMSTIGILQLFTEPLMIMSGSIFGLTMSPTQMLGGADHGVLTSGLYIFVNAFNRFRFGLAAAMSYVLFMVILLATIINSRVLGGRSGSAEGGL
jgi:cellobiose transport system permease protein